MLCGMRINANGDPGTMVNEGKERYGYAIFGTRMGKMKREGWSSTSVLQTEAVCKAWGKEVVEWRM